MEETVVFAFDLDSFLRWKQSDHRHLPCRLVTADLTVATLCEKENIACEEVWNYLNASDITQTHQVCESIINEWWIPYLGAIRPHNIVLADAFKRDLLYAFIAAHHCHQSVTRILEEKKPSLSIVFTDFSNPTFWDFGEKPFPDVLNAVTLWTHRQKQIKTYELSIDALKKIKNPLPDKMFSTSVPQLCQISPYPKKNRILSWVDSTTLERRMTPFLNKLEGEENIEHWVVSLNTDPIYKNFKNTISFEECLSLSPKNEILELEIEKAWKKFQIAQNTDTNFFPFLFQNSFLNFQFKFFFERLKKAVGYTDALFLLFQGLQPKICLGEWDCEGFAILRQRVAKACGVKTVAFHHTGIAPNFHQFNATESEADTLMVEGKTNKEGFEKLGRNSKTIYTIGTFTKTTPINENNFLQKEIFLLTTSGWGLAAPMANLFKLRNLWKNILRIIQVTPDFQFTIKMHPYFDDYSFFETFPHFPNLKFIREKKEGLFRDAFLALVVGAPTTSALEAMRAGIPVVYLREPLYSSPDFLSALDDKRVACVNDAQELDSVIHTFRNNHTTYTGAQNNAQAFLADFFDTQNFESTLSNFLSALYSSLAPQRVKKITYADSLNQELFAMLFSLQDYRHNEMNNELLNQIISFAVKSLISKKTDFFPPRRIFALSEMLLDEARIAFHNKNRKAGINNLWLSIRINPRWVFKRLFFILLKKPLSLLPSY